MVELFEKDIQSQNRQSSKGNQLKWRKNHVWYKADYTGYEGLSEYIVSQLLGYSSLTKDEFILYKTENIKYKYQVYHGCSSENILPQGWQMITLERLFRNIKGESLYKCIYKIENIEERARFMVNEIIRWTGLKDFGIYLTKMMTIDAFFLNEDRHTHNIALLVDERGYYHYCPYFDHGACLLSDTTMDYPIDENLYDLIDNVHSKTICSNFDEQLDAFENLYGQPLKFYFQNKDLQKIIEEEPYYSNKEKQRVFDVVIAQKSKYQYLMKENENHINNESSFYL